MFEEVSFEEAMSDEGSLNGDGEDPDAMQARTQRLMRLNAWLRSPAGRIVVRVYSIALPVALERWSIAKGSRKGLRHVDARTGGPPSLRQTVMLHSVRSSLNWLVTYWIRLRASAPQERNVSPSVSCLPAISRAIVISALDRMPVPFIATRRTVADLIAGTALPPAGPTRWNSLRHRLARVRRAARRR